MPTKNPAKTQKNPAKTQKNPAKTQKPKNQNFKKWVFANPAENLRLGEGDLGWRPLAPPNFAKNATIKLVKIS